MDQVTGGASAANPTAFPWGAPQVIFWLWTLGAQKVIRNFSVIKLWLMTMFKWIRILLHLNSNHLWQFWVDWTSLCFPSGREGESKNSFTPFCTYVDLMRVPSFGQTFPSSEIGCFPFNGHPERADTPKSSKEACDQVMLVKCKSQYLITQTKSARSLWH